MSDRPPMARAQRLLLKSSRRLPRRVRHRVFGPPPVNDLGDRLADDLWWMLGLHRVLGPPLDERTPSIVREGLLDGALITEGRVRSRVTVTDTTLAGRGARVYHPGGQGLPALLYAHGGGWVAGSLRSHDRWCQRLADEARVVVVSLDYRLAPEDPFPAGLEDMVAAFDALGTRAAELGFDPERVSVGGDSAGGNLAAACCLVRRDRGLALPRAQVLIYPGLDLRCVAPSLDLFPTGYLLERASIDWYIDQYAPGRVEEPYVSPQLADDHRGLPPALLAPAGFDPIRDDSVSYARVLRRAGVEVVWLPLADQVHGFLQTDGAIPSARRACFRVTRAVHALLHREVR